MQTQRNRTWKRPEERPLCSPQRPLGGQAAAKADFPTHSGRRSKNCTHASSQASPCPGSGRPALWPLLGLQQMAPLSCVINPPSLLAPSHQHGNTCSSIPPVNEENEAPDPMSSSSACPPALSPSLKAVRPRGISAPLPLQVDPSNLLQSCF